MMLFGAHLAKPVQVAMIQNGTVRVRAVMVDGEDVEELAVKGASGDYQNVLLSPTHPDLKPQKPEPRANLLRVSDSGLFDGAPTFRFTKTDVDAGERTMTLTAMIGDWKVTKEIRLPEHGNVIVETLTAKCAGAYPQIRYLLNSYAFAPGKPDETWAPALRPLAENVIGDHFFRSPAAVIRKGSLGATMMPDLDTLKENRPIPTILDLDVSSGVASVPLLSYGFCDHRLSAHVRYSTDASMVHAVPKELISKCEIRLDGDAKPDSQLHAAVDYMWARYGHGYFDKILPQTMEFAKYAELCYPAAFNEKMTGGWFQRTIDGQECGGVPAGWGLGEGWVSWQCWFNQLRSAWGVRWWGQRLNHLDWVAKADKMLNLALAAPSDHGACPTTYMSKTNQWKGSLITPTGDCYYDVPSIAWKGIWYLRWLQFKDCPRREEVQKQADAIFGLMKTVQRSDGSFPSWLSKDLKVVPMLDRSAQSGLPAWFVGEYAEMKKASLSQDQKNEIQGMLTKCGEFLTQQVLPERLYYDFETFFSCSPKICLQKDGAVDNQEMWDMRTMQAPQNTLSMQWCAEAIRHMHPFDPSAAKTDDDAAMPALDTMCMYQNVWPISYRPVAYTFGGFGVQNSDGEYNDARQAQFGATLCDFGTGLGRRDLFERGVAGVRGALTLVNIPNDPFHVYPNPNYPPGLEPENCGHGGSNEQDGRTGFDWGEGSGLAAAAELIDKYGQTYKGRDWSVLIDGTPPPPVEEKPLVNPTFAMNDWRMPGWTSSDATFLTWPVISKRMDFGNHGEPFIGTCEDGKGAYDDAYVGSMTSPVFIVTKPTMHIMVGGGNTEGVGVELIDETGKRLILTRGINAEELRQITWRIPEENQGKPLRIRIFDHETGGWGHINVGKITTP